MNASFYPQVHSQLGLWEKSLKKNKDDLLDRIQKSVASFSQWNLELDAQLEVLKTTLPHNKPALTKLDEIQIAYLNMPVIDTSLVIKKINERILLDTKHSISPDSLLLIAASQDTTLEKLKENILHFQKQTEFFEKERMLLSEAVITMENARDSFEKKYNYLTYLATNNYLKSKVNSFSFNAGYNMNHHTYIKRPSKKTEEAVLERTHLHRADSWGKSKLDQGYSLHTNASTLINKVENAIKKFEKWNGTVRNWLNLSSTPNPDSIKAKYKKINVKEMALQYLQLIKELKERIASDCKNKISNKVLNTIALANDITTEEIESSLLNFKKQTQMLISSQTGLETIFDSMNRAIFELQKSYHLYCYLKENNLSYTWGNELYFEAACKVKTFDDIHQD